MAPSLLVLHGSYRSDRVGIRLARFLVDAFAARGAQSPFRRGGPAGLAARHGRRLNWPAQLNSCRPWASGRREWPAPREGGHAEITARMRSRSLRLAALVFRRTVRTCVRTVSSDTRRARAASSAVTPPARETATAASARVSP
jgi:hypothetical protein